jgi:fluoride exporter
MRIYQILLVGMGGMIGSMARFILSRTVEARANSIFPLGTLSVNIIGSLILGLIYALTLRRAGLDDSWRIFLATGFCGGFTTFSAFALENFTLLHQRPAISVAYICLSVILGVLSIALGFFAGKSLME